MSQTPQIDCRHFSGYKPCTKNEVCSSLCPHKQRAQPRVLVIHLEALGAVLRATAVLPAIKREWPDSHITWITGSSAAPLLENNPLIDRILRNNHGDVLALGSLSFDYTFCIDKSLMAAGLMEVPIEAGDRRGFGVQSSTGAIIPLNPEAQRLWELGLSNHEKFFINKEPETRLITEALGLTWNRDEYVFEFTEDEKIFKEKERGRLALGRNVIGLNTGCSSMLPHKKLSVSGWIELTRQLVRKFPRNPFLLLGGPEDTTRNNEIAAVLTDLGGRVAQTPTALGLRSGLIYTDLCEVVVTGDSLGMHMAIALKKYVVCWFGPSCMQEIDFYNRGEGVKTHAECSPCWKRECHKPIMCYDRVDFSQMVSAVERGLRHQKRTCQKVSAQPIVEAL